MLQIVLPDESGWLPDETTFLVVVGSRYIPTMSMNNDLFKKAWYLSWGHYVPGVNTPNFNKLSNHDRERIASSIPTAYWDLAQTVTVDDALHVYEARRLASY